VRRTSGFSLLELVVALLFMGLLLGGMVRVWRASLASWARVNETLTAQRALRWAMDRIKGDLRMMGGLFPPPELRSLDLPAGPDPALQSGFMLVPGELDGQPADELSWVVDVPVPGAAELAGDSPAGAEGEVTLQVRPAGAMDLEAGDLMLVAGDRFEFARVAGPAHLALGRPGLVRVVRPDGAGGAAFAYPHGAGAWVRWVRPLRVVRYAVVPMALDAAAGRVPCLVRFETAYPRDRAAPRWSRLLAAGRGREGSHEVVAEHVAGFRVDFSPDRRFPGIRGAGYAATFGNLDARLRAQGGAGASDPLWFRGAGGLIEVRLAIRSPVARDGYAPAREPPAPRFLVLSQRLLAAPRNFGR
jgi:hypothetical protein